MRREGTATSTGMWGRKGTGLKLRQGESLEVSSQERTGSEGSWDAAGRGRGEQCPITSARSATHNTLENALSTSQPATSGMSVRLQLQLLWSRACTWQHRNLYDCLHFRTALIPHEESSSRLDCFGLHTASHHPHDLSPSLIPLVGSLAGHSTEATIHAANFPIEPFFLPRHTHRLNEPGTGAT